MSNDTEKNKEVNEKSLIVKTALEVLKRIPKPKDGKNGKDADENKIIVKTVLQVLKRLEKPKDGKDGKDAPVPIIDYKDIVKEIVSAIPKSKEIDEKDLEKRILSKVPKSETPKADEELAIKVSEAQKAIKDLKGKHQELYKQLSFNNSNYSSYGGEIDKLSQLTGDVTITSPQNNDNLVYSSSLGKWRNTQDLPGGVTSVSVVSANGLAGSVTTPTTTPAITLSTTVSGILKGNGTAISAATDGTDYWSPGSLASPVRSVSNSDSTLIISPTTGTVVASLNLANANTWTGGQTYTAGGKTLQFGNNTQKITTNDTDLYLESTGAGFGTVSLRLTNITGLNGAQFLNDSGVTGDVIDFSFKGHSGANSNFRWEGRTSSVSESVYGVVMFKPQAPMAASDKLGVYTNNSGSPVEIDWYNFTSVANYRPIGSMVGTWATATDASRKGRVVWNVYDTSPREAMQMEANGSAAMIGFLGATAVVQQTALGAGLANLGLFSSALYSSVALTNQGADITATNLATTTGTYQVNYVLEDTTADVTAGTVTLTISWTDGAGATTVVANQLLTGTGRTSGVIYVQLASGNLTYAITHTGAYGTAKYALYIDSIKLQ